MQYIAHSAFWMGYVVEVEIKLECRINDKSYFFPTYRPPQVARVPPLPQRCIHLNGPSVAQEGGGAPGALCRGPLNRVWITWWPLITLWAGPDGVVGRASAEMEPDALKITSNEINI